MGTDSGERWANLSNEEFDAFDAKGKEEFVRYNVLRIKAMGGTIAEAEKGELEKLAWEYDRNYARERFYRGAFLRERIAELEKDESITPAEAEDLDRRLLHALEEFRDTLDAEAWKQVRDRGKVPKEPSDNDPVAVVTWHGLTVNTHAETLTELLHGWLDAAADKHHPLLKKARTEAWAKVREEGRGADYYRQEGWEPIALVLEGKAPESFAALGCLYCQAVAATWYGYEAAYVWPEVLDAWRVGNAPTLAARAALQEAANTQGKPDSLAAMPEAEGRLAQAVRERLGKMPSPPRTREGLQAEGERDGMLSADAVLADFIAELGLEGCKTSAESLRKQWRVDWANAPEPWARWENPLRAPKVLARVLWGLKVRPELAREHDPEKHVVRVGTDLSKAFAQARAYGGRMSDQQGQALILVEPPSGTALMLPFDDGLRVTTGNGVVGLRQVLKPGSLRSYLATLVLYQDGGMREDGSFPVEGPASILDVTGATKHEDRKAGKVYRRFATKDIRAVEEDLRLFARIRVRSVGTFEAAAGDPLLDEIRDRRSGRTAFYAHSRLVVGQLHNNYFRIPRAVCRLPVGDIPLAMGIAQVAREGMVRHLKSNKPIEAPIRDWLEAAGINGHEGARKLGRSFWPKVTEDLTRIAREGKLGTITEAGRGPEVVLTFTPEELLRTSYGPLLEASKAHQRAKQAALVADKRKPRGHPGT